MGEGCLLVNSGQHRRRESRQTSDPDRVTRQATALPAEHDGDDGGENTVSDKRFTQFTTTQSTLTMIQLVSQL